MKTSPESEIKKIYEKSVRLLNDKQARLMDMQQVLKKAVIRLSLASRTDNHQVNKVLTDIKLSVDDHVNIDMLNKYLDDLFLLINHSDYHLADKEKNALYDYLKKYIGEDNDPKVSDDIILKLKGIIAKKLPDEKVSNELLKLIEGLSEGNRKYNDSIKTFISDINESTGFHYDSTGNDASVILQDLAMELTEYIYTLNSKSATSGEKNDYEIDINGVLHEIVSQISLPSTSKKDKFEVVKLLNNSTVSELKDIIQKIVQLVNDSINSIEQEKQDLESYLIKISTQLEDIESFMHLMRRDKDEANTRSLALTSSVETGVCSLEDTITKSTDLSVLKHDVASNLKEIRKHVEDFKQAEKVKKEISLESYAKIIGELSQSQKESSKLQEQLHESKIQLLRDPLTGIANRLAYDERILVEFNRWKRNNTPLCWALWDIDHFKKINDQYGHGVGDRVLKLFTEIIYSRIRKIDLFARIGGEEFVLIMPDTSLEKALKLNNQLRILLEECNFHYDGQHCLITSSVGIAEFRRGDKPEEVLDRADKALYQSKDGGRNRCTVFKMAG